MSDIKTKPTINYLQRNGFVMVSNLLIDYQEELGISDDELVFITKIMKNTSSWRLHDSDISTSVSTKTLQRRRKSLKDKGLLDYKTITVTNSLGQKFNDGINYDLSKLEEKLQEISNKIETEKIKTIKEEIKEKGLEISEEELTDISESPLLKFKEDWKKIYGTEYEVTKQEREEYNKLNSKEKEYFKYIFNYCISKKLLDKITPRLSLFLKTPFRMTDLKNWCFENTKEFSNQSPIIENVLSSISAEEKELKDDNDLTEEDMKELFNDLTSKKYLPLAKEIYKIETGELLTIGESYFDEIYNRIYAVLIENNAYDLKELKNENIIKQIKKEITNAPKSRDIWNNGEPVPELNFGSSAIKVLEDEKNENEDSVFGEIFKETTEEKLIKRKEEYHKKILEEANKNIAVKSEEEILKELEGDAANDILNFV